MKKNINFTFALLFINTFASLMGMESYPSFKEAQAKISGMIEKNAYAYKKEFRKQKEHEQLNSIDEMCTFKFSDIPKIAENNIDQGILLEQHFSDIVNIDSLEPHISIQNILKNHIDKQQKLMSMIKCSHFINHKNYYVLIQYLVQQPDKIPQEILELPDTTIKSLNQIHKMYTRTSEDQIKLLEEIVPEKNLTKWSSFIDKHNFNGIINDIKTCLYDQEAYSHEIIKNNAFRFFTKDLPTWWQRLVLPTEDKEEKIRISRLKNHFNTTSLPNKISLIITLDNAIKALLKKSDILKQQPFGLINWALLLTTYISYITGGAIIMIYMFINKRQTRLLKDKYGMPIMMLGSVSFPLFFAIPSFYFLLKSLPSSQAKNLLKRILPIKNLIEEFKESIKKEYSL